MSFGVANLTGIVLVESSFEVFCRAVVVDPVFLATKDVREMLHSNLIDSAGRVEKGLTTRRTGLPAKLIQCRQAGILACPE
jgi:hypothetical protein